MTNRDQIIESLATISENVSNMNKRLSSFSEDNKSFRESTTLKLDAIKDDIRLSQIDIKELQIWKVNHKEEHKNSDKNLNKWKFLISGSILSFIVGAGILGIKHFYESGKTNNNITEKNRRIAHDSESAE